MFHFEFDARCLVTERLISGVIMISIIIITIWCAGVTLYSPSVGACRAELLPSSFVQISCGVWMTFCDQEKISGI